VDIPKLLHSTPWYSFNLGVNLGSIPYANIANLTQMQHGNSYIIVMVPQGDPANPLYNNGVYNYDGDTWKI
jgi:hypothetical protein